MVWSNGLRRSWLSTRQEQNLPIGLKPSFDSLARLSLSKAKRRPELRIPPDHLLSRVATSFGATFPCLPEDGCSESWRLGPLFRAIEEELTVRIRNTALKDWTGAISIETDVG